MLACPVRDFQARVEAGPWDRLVIEAGGAPLEYSGLGAAMDAPLPAEVDGLERLVLAAALRLARHIDATAGGASADIRDARPLHTGLRIACDTTIPRQVGLAGSSAVIIATIRALTELWSLDLSRFDVAEMALATELEDLGIAAGPMDRVIQSYEQVMVLELAPPRSESNYRRVDPSSIPPLVLAWDPAGGEPSGLTHSDLRARWLAGDETVLQTVRELRDLVDEGLEAVEAGDAHRFAELVDRNFDLRCRVTSPTERDRDMVRLAREVGAAGKLCGSGGAVVLAPRSGVRLDTVEAQLAGAGYSTCRPRIS